MKELEKQETEKSCMKAMIMIIMNNTTYESQY